MEVVIPKLNLKYTKPICDFFKSCDISTEFPNYLKELINAQADASSISYELLTKVHSAAVQDTILSPPRLWQLLIATEVDLPQVKIPERNPILEQRIQDLKSRFAMDEYNRMTSNVSSGFSALGKTRQDAVMDNINWGAEIKQVNRYLLMFLNFIIVVVCSFFAGYKGVELIVPKGLNTFHIQLVSGFCVAFVVFFADLYFLLKNLLEDEETCH